MKKRFEVSYLNPKAGAFLKWFYPGMGIKRWIGLASFAVCLLMAGALRFRSAEYWLIRAFDAVTVFCGIVILILSVKRLVRSLVSVFVPSSTIFGPRESCLRW